MKKAKSKEVNYIKRGDSFKEIKKIPNKSVDLIITSPPYADKRKRYYDSVHPDKYVEWFTPLAKELQRVLKPKGSFILNIKEHPREGERDTYVLELVLSLKKMGWYWIEEYCWYKKNSFPGKWPNRFRDAWERCLHFTLDKDFSMYQDAVKVPIGDWAEKRFKSMSKKDFVRHVSGTNESLGRNVSNWLNKKKVYPHNVLVFEDEHYLHNGKDQLAEVTNLIEFATVCYNKKHSAAFPIELPTWFIRLLSKKGDVVFDPFIGSGTTAVAAKLLDRNFIGIEKDKEFVDVAKKSLKEASKLKRK
jgi:site-specific DNA-methyltransferase (adenine-specific)/site-specific DNA-methyltransferase (cytosine-N4-specific)